MPIIPSIVGFSQGDAVVPTVTGFLARAIFLLTQQGMLSADIVVAAALGGDTQALAQLTAFIETMPQVDADVEALVSLLAQVRLK